MTKQDLSSIDKIVLHHSASPRAITTAAMIRGWHKERGFDDIGYHFIIEADGALRYGRALDVVPAAQKGANTNTLAICLVGDNTVPGQGWNGEQMITARFLIAILRAVIGHHMLLVGHRDLAATLCPGLEVRDAFPDLTQGD